MKEVWVVFMGMGKKEVRKYPEDEVKRLFERNGECGIEVRLARQDEIPIEN